jgi:hypothetical protein
MILYRLLLGYALARGAWRWRKVPPRASTIKAIDAALRDVWGEAIELQLNYNAIQRDRMYLMEHFARREPLKPSRALLPRLRRQRRRLGYRLERWGEALRA